ncbi:MAG TPA: 50S ribosomal protein L10 [Candidatus Methanoperedenaceae archaeon]|nr:50S ribosomal protein L10 [Candidatus Methanoperedenaceae archaeon]
MDEQHQSKHIPQWKKDEVDDIKKNLSAHRVVGVVAIRGIPSNQLQVIRKSMRGQAYIKMARNSLIDIALSGGSQEPLGKYVDDQTALIFTNENPFKLYRMLEKSKTKAPIRAGAVSPRDIVVEKGPTSFPPGPIVGELQGAGIPAGIDGGKVVIRETKTVAKAGDVVSPKLATMLARLEIFPMEQGLSLKAAFENGMLFEPGLLAIDEVKYAGDITAAARSAFNLAMNAAYPTPETIKSLITSAASKSRALAIGAELPVKEVMDVVVSKAYSQMLSLADAASKKNPDALDADLKGRLGARKAASPAQEVKQEKPEKKEEKKEEKKTEEEAAAGLGALFG